MFALRISAIRVVQTIRRLIRKRIREKEEKIEMANQNKAN
jgi:hypothetical protein